MTKPVPTHHLTGKPLGNRPDREKTEEILQRLRQAANDRHADGFTPGMGDDQVQALENVLFPSARQEKTGSRFPVLIAVFMVSAIAGGAIAGLYLARNGARPPVLQVTGAKPAEMVVEKNVPSQEMTAAETTVSRKDQAQLVAEVRPAGDTAVQASGTAPQPIAPPPLDAGTPLEKPPVPAERTVAASADAVPSAPTATAETSSEAATAAVSPDNELAKNTTQVVENLEQQLPQPADFNAAAEGAGGGSAAAPAGNGGNEASAQSPDELKALTDNVVQALGALIPGAENTAEPASTSDLRMALSALVDKAMQEGRSKNEIISLLDKAIEEAGAENIPEELLGPDGKVDLNLLIASVIPKDMTMVSSRDRSYVKQLLAEGRKTTLTGQEGPQARKDRFYTRNGKRYTRIRRGDTLAQIAYDAYGDALAYPRILRANSGRISSVRNLRPGMEIRVPGRNERLTDTAEPASLVQGTKTARRTAIRKRTTRKTVKRTTARKTIRRRQDARRRQAAPKRKTEPKITDRLLGVIGATSSGQAQDSTATQAKPADEPTLTTNFQRYKIGTPPSGN